MVTISWTRPSGDRVRSRAVHLRVRSSIDAAVAHTETSGPAVTGEGPGRLCAGWTFTCSQARGAAPTGANGHAEPHRCAEMHRPSRPTHAHTHTCTHTPCPSPWTTAPPAQPRGSPGTRNDKRVPKGSQQEGECCPLPQTHCRSEAARTRRNTKCPRQTHSCASMCAGRCVRGVCTHARPQSKATQTPLQESSAQPHTRRHVTVPTRVCGCLHQVANHSSGDPPASSQLSPPQLSGSRILAQGPSWPPAPSLRHGRPTSVLLTTSHKDPGWLCTRGLRHDWAIPPEGDSPLLQLLLGTRNSEARIQDGLSLQTWPLEG